MAVWSKAGGACSEWLGAFTAIRKYQYRRRFASKAVDNQETQTSHPEWLAPMETVSMHVLCDETGMSAARARPNPPPLEAHWISAMTAASESPFWFA